MFARQSFIREMVLIALFAALTAVGAFIKIPLPLVPFTLQVFFVFLAGNLLTAKQAASAQALYAGIGLLGIPIFTGGGGIGYVFQPSFGYLIGFIVGAYLIAALLSRQGTPSKGQFIFANLVGLAVIYFIGLIYFYGILNFWLDKPTSWSGAFGAAVLPFIIPDLIKCILSALLAEKLRPRLSGKS